MGRTRRAVVGLLGAALVLTWGAVGQAEGPPLGAARISAVEGEAQVQLGDEGVWRAAALNMPLLPGDRLQTGPNGRLEILLSNGAAIRLGPAGAARLVAVPPTEPTADATAEVDLEAGRAIVATQDGDRSRPTMTVNATGTRIQVYPGSRVRADVVAPDATDVTLRDGAATAEALGASIPLRVGEAMQVGRGGALLVAGIPQDELDRWSESRDRTAAAAPPSPYVPTPLEAGAGELNRYGQWTSAPEYGNVWVPSAVPAGWAPFTAGEWMWRGGTWVWVSAEPWGWVPFHYGRWRWDPFLHWYWVPPQPRLAVWCPGAVAWIRTPSYVTWIPLAPGEIYYSPWPAGMWSAAVPPTTVINITNITIIKKTFVNAAAPAPLVVVPATTFGRTRVVTAGARGVGRASLATVMANQTASVVTPAALVPAPADRRRGTPGTAAAPPTRGTQPGIVALRAGGAPPAPGLAPAPPAPRERPTGHQVLGSWHTIGRPQPLAATAPPPALSRAIPAAPVATPVGPPAASGQVTQSIAVPRPAARDAGRAATLTPTAPLLSRPHQAVARPDAVRPEIQHPPAMLAPRPVPPAFATAQPIRPAPAQPAPPRVEVRPPQPPIQRDLAPGGGPGFHPGFAMSVPARPAPPAFAPPRPSSGPAAALAPPRPPDHHPVTQAAPAPPPARSAAPSHPQVQRSPAPARSIPPGNTARPS